MATPGFTHLHVHSHYSLLDGLGKIDDILKATKEKGMNSVALTDHGVLYGAVEWFKRSKDYGVKPIMGLEGYISPNRMDQKRAKIDARPYHVTLIAKNMAGYKNLIKLVTLAHLEGYYYKPRFDYETLAKHSEGLICLSGCMAAHLPREILSGNIDQGKEIIGNYQKLFGKENYFLELQRPFQPEQKILNDRLLEFSKAVNVPIVATNDVHSVNKEDEVAHDILLCVQTGKKVHEKDRMSYVGLELYLKSPQEMEKAFPTLPEALSNTQRIAEQCTFEIELGKVHLPKFDVPAGRTPEQQLRIECQENVEKRYGMPWEKATEEIRKRVDYELGVIEKTGFASYFLIVQDYVKWAKEKDIVVGPGRGSAAGSIIAYLLFITDVDPLHWGLFFERFLNPARISPPDIDLDFDDTRRDEVIEYCAKKYGRDRVAQIITFGTIKARNGIRDAGRVLDVPYSVCDRIAKMIPMKFNLREALEKLPELQSLYQSDPQAKKLIDAAKKLEGVARHAGTHASAVVICDQPFKELVPCQFATRGTETTQIITTQYEMHAIEDLGLLKMDFLGLSNLTIIRHTLDIIKKRHGKTLDIGHLPLDDKKTFKLFQAARTTGVFQLESSGMKRYLKELRPTELEDIVAMVALYRPGPMQYIPQYIERKHKKSTPVYLHPKLEPILEKTQGIAVYQEQVMQIARDLAGFSLAEADLLRKAVGKKIKKLLVEQRAKFIEGCLKNGVSQDIAEQVFAFIEPFAGYGFNRAHAVCYAMIAYQTAYLKANYPAEFMAALLRSDEDDTDRLAIEMAECQRMQLPVLPPSVNQSYKHFTVINLGADGKPLGTEKAHQHIEGVKTSVRFGLAGVKNLGSDAVEAIIEERTRNGPYASLADLVSRVSPSSMNKKSLESLIKSGALDEFDERAKMLASIEDILQFGRNAEANRNSKQLGLFGTTGRVAPVLRLEQVEPASSMQRLKWEKELLGLYVSAQPLSEHRELIERHAHPIGSLTLGHAKQQVRVVGLISHVQKIVTRSNEAMMFIQVDDFSGNVEVLIFPSVLREHAALLVEDSVLVFEGKVSDKEGMLKILANSVTVFDPQQLQGQTKLGNDTRSQQEAYYPAQPAPEPDPVTHEAPPAAEPLPDGKHVELLLEKAFSADKLRSLKTILETLPQGDIQVLLRVQEGPHERRIRTNYRVTLAPAERARIEEIIGKGKVYG
jgi:DNA polymerase-3 subunit alpha